MVSRSTNGIKVEVIGEQPFEVVFQDEVKKAESVREVADIVDGAEFAFIDIEGREAELVCRLHGNLEYEIHYHNNLSNLLRTLTRIGVIYEVTPCSTHSWGSSRCFGDYGSVTGRIDTRHQDNLI